MQRQRLPVYLSLLALATAIYAIWLGLPSAQCSTSVFSGFVVLAGVATLALAPGKRPKLKLAVACSLLIAMAGIVVSGLFGHNLLSFNPFSDARYATFLASLLGLTAFGLYRNWFAARWLALALAFAGIMSAGLNLAPWALLQHAYTWTLAIHIAGALLVIANLLGSDVRKRFEGGANQLWSSSEPALKSIRWTILAFFAAIPMLLVYAWMQPIVPVTAVTALGLVGFLSLSIALALSQKVLGALGLVLGGLGLLAQTAVTVWLAHNISAVDGQIALYYAAFWAPAGLAALVCGLRLTKPVVRLLID